MNKIKFDKNAQIAVFGLGKFGRSIAATLYENGMQVLCCDVNPALVQEATEYCTYAIEADVTDPTVLTKIGLGNFDAVIVAFSRDFEAAVITCMIAKEMKIPFVMAKANGIRQKKIMENIGVDRVVLPEMEMGERIAYQFITNDPMEYIHRSEEYEIIEMHPKPGWIGKTLQKLALRQSEGINILAIIREGKVMAVLGAQSEIKENDNLIVLKLLSQQ
ncbi:TrkA family potassium uptake protein [Lachnospiraceae bacterium 54-53]